MSVSKHYEAEALIALLDRRDSNVVSKDEHMSSCSACGEVLDSYRSIVDCLGEAAVWNGAALSAEPAPGTIAALRAAAEGTRREDEQAEALVAELTAGLRSEWMPRLLADAKYRSAGVVRRLFAASDAVAMKSPGDDLELTRLSTEIADHLEPSQHPAGVVARLRGSAWRDRAYALNYAGDTAAALKALTSAEQQYAGVSVADYDIARLELTRALVLRGLDRFDDGLRAVRIARNIFAAAQDDHRLRIAKSIEANLLYSAGDVRRALQLWRELEQALSLTDDPMRAGVLHNLSLACRDLGDLDAALDYLHKAAQVHATVDETASIVKTRWNIGSILILQRRYEEADRILTDVIAAFEELHMREDVVLARLDRAELLTIRLRFDEVIAICREVIDELRRSRLEHTIRAMTAVSYLSEATLARKVTPALVRQVRDFVRDVRTEPALLFAPPPL